MRGSHAMNYSKLLALLCCVTILFVLGSVAVAADENPELLIIKTDNGVFPGSATGITHQRASTYLIRKVLNVDAVTLKTASEARVLVYFALVDRAENDPIESFDVIVNDHVTTLAFTDSPLTAHWEVPGNQNRRFAWFEVPISVAYLQAGDNTIILRKSPLDESPKDYMYVGIDHTANFGNSAYSTDGGKTWNTAYLNDIKSTGEYMIRLALVPGRPTQVATLHYEPDLDMIITDPGAIIRDYASSSRTLSITLQPKRIGTATRLALSANVELADYQVRWLDNQGKLLYLGADVVLGQQVPSQLLIMPQDGKEPDYIQHLEITYQPPLGLESGGEKRPSITPKVSAPIAQATVQTPQCSITADEVILSNGYLRFKLATGQALSMQELQAAYTNWENVIRHPEATELFWLLVNNEQVRARDFKVLDVRPLAAPACGVQVELLAEKYALQGTLKVQVDTTQEIQIGLQLQNKSTTESLRVKTAFPHLGGIVISEHEEDDYYLFPIKGGVISNETAYLNTAYGETTAFWQMIDTYSPSKGMGVYVRIDDATGIHKHMSLSKGEEQGVTFNSVGYRAPDYEISWAAEKLLPADHPGTALGFGYQARTLAPAAKHEFPTAIIGVHAGDWHAAMENYAEWAHRVWTWQPYPSALTGLYGYNLVAGTGMLKTNPDTSRHYQLEYAELSPGWWLRGETGPWGVPLDKELKQANELLGTAYMQRKKDWFGVDSVTGKMMFALNRGDYEYNPAWGGLTTLKNYVDGLKEAGAKVGVITYPLLVSGDTKLGRAYGERLGVMNPIWDKDKRKYEGSLWTPLNPAGYVNAYAAWNMCLDNAEYHDLFIANMKRLAEDLRVGIRVDEMGISRANCYSKKHEHIYAKEPGDLTYFQGQGEFLRKLRLALDEVDPYLPLIAESPGNDYLSRSLTGALVYNTSTSVRVPELSPVIYSLIRFYFPEVRLFDFLVNETEEKYYQQAFWQAMPLRGAPWDMESQYPRALFEILKENTDAFDGFDLEPFIPTLNDNVYANRFATENKTVYQFYNDTGMLFTGDLLTVAHNPQVHYFDLINLKEVRVSEAGTIGTTIGVDMAASIAQLPRLISGEVVNERLLVSFGKELLTDGQMVVQVYDENKRMIFVEKDVTKPEVSVPVGFFNTNSFRIKLLRDGILLDAIEVAK